MNIPQNISQNIPILNMFVEDIPGTKLYKRGEKGNVKDDGE